MYRYRIWIFVTERRKLIILVIGSFASWILLPCCLQNCEQQTLKFVPKIWSVSSLKFLQWVISLQRLQANFGWKQVTKVQWEKIAKAKCNLVSQAAATWQDMANRGKRVHFCNDGEEWDEPEEAYEVYEVYDYITCVISKMVGGLRRKKKLCRGREQMGEVDGTVRPQAAAVRN